MSIPLPKEPLGSHCSVISDNTLYTVSSNAFQAIELSNGSKWQTLTSPISTSGAVCVHAGKGTENEALYVVGGSTSNPDTVPDKGYTGLQRWKFSAKKWEQITVTDAVTFNLTGHGATYMDDSSELIVFSGTKYPTPADTPSANTYLLSITDTTAYVTAIPASQALLSPLVLSWGTTGALVVGGNSGNTNLNLYTPQAGWQDLSTRLSAGLAAAGSAGASLIDGDDGSKMLLVFDFTQSPTAVTETLVAKAGGATKVKRDSTSTSSLTAGNWPTYDDSDAPEGARTDTSVATDGDTVVISGGDDDNPLLMFSARKNSWVDTQQVFNADSDKSRSSSSAKASSTSKPSATSSSKSSATSTSESSASASGAVSLNVPTDTSSLFGAASSSAAVSSGSSSGLSTVQLLFVVLGSILGAAVLLGVILLFLRRKHQQRKQSGDGFSVDDPKSRMSFQDRGASFMKEAGGSLSPSSGLEVPRAPGFSNAGNTDSWGQVQQFAAGATTLADLKGGPRVHVIGGQGVISNPGSVPTPPPNDKAAGSFGQRSSGWSKYFSSNNTTNLMGQPQRVYSNAGRSSGYTDTSSYAMSQMNGVHPNPYLHNAGPGVAAGGLGVASPPRAVDSRRVSDLSVSSAGGDSYSSGIPESIRSEAQDVWSPVAEPESVALQAGPRRGPITSSVYPESLRNRDTQYSDYSGPPQRQNMTSDLSWLNLKQN